MEKLNKRRFKLTSNSLKKTLTISAIVLTLMGPGLPAIAYAAEGTENEYSQDSVKPDLDETINKVELTEDIIKPDLDEVINKVELTEDTINPDSTEIIDEGNQEQTNNQLNSNTETYATSVEVQDWNSMKRALEDSSVTDIKMVSNINVGSSVKVAGTRKSIDASGYTLNMKGYDISGVRAGKYNLSNVVLAETSSKGGPFSSTELNVEVTYSNVTHSGEGFMNLSKGVFNLVGTINSTVPNSGNTSITASSLNVLADSNVTMINNTKYSAIDLVSTSGGGLEVANGSTLKVTSLGNTIDTGTSNRVDLYGSLIVESKNGIGLKLGNYTNLTTSSILSINAKEQSISGDKSKLEFLEGTEADITSTSKTSGVTASRIWVRDYASLKVLGSGTGSAVQILSEDGFEATDLSNIDIRSMGTAPALGSSTRFYPFVLNSNSGIKTWSVNYTENADQSKYYAGPIKSSFKQKYNTTSDKHETNQKNQIELSSNNSAFLSEFLSPEVGRIATGKYAIPSDYEEPTLISPDKIEIEKGSIFDPLKVDGLSASDYKGTDISDLIKYTGSVDTNIPGEYTITYSVADSFGVVTTKDMLVVVKEEQTLQPTTINELTTESTQVSGTAEPNSFIEIKVGNEVIASGKVGSDGKYNLTIPQQKVGTKVTAVAKLNGQSSEAYTVVKEGPVSTVGTITPSEYKLGDSEIKGTYTGDVAKARVTINGQVQAWGGTFNNGTFTYYVGSNKIKDGDIVTISGYDKNDKLLDTKPVKIIKVTQGTITPSEYKLGDSEIKGTYTGDVAKARVTINGQVQAWGGTFSNGTFTYYVGSNKIKDGDIVTISGYDKNDKLLDTKPVKIIKVTQGTITPSEYKLGDSEIKGTYTGDVAKARVTINGQVQAWGGTFNNGTFTYYVGSNKIKSGDNVTITAYDKNDKVLDANKVVKIKEDTAQGTITPSEYKLGDSEIKGTYTGDVAKARVTINGQVQ
ncbi:immunoglobulin-like domain-containing protein, partial [Carnobacterium divergens]|uniref:immunoglobulin-like domain-containing protein n=1 Tax=Carnobacterium divergens TaxID=2748 RepID=UPI002892088C